MSPNFVYHSLVDSLIKKIANSIKNTSTEEQTVRECTTRVTEKVLHAAWMFAEPFFWQVVILERKLHSRSDRRWSCKTRQARGTPNRIFRCLAQH